MSDPNIWLQADEVSGKFDDCTCRLDAVGPDGEEGAAFYMCPLHEAAPKLLQALRAVMEGQIGGNPDMDAERFQMARAAIAKAEGRGQ